MIEHIEPLGMAAMVTYVAAVANGIFLLGRKLAPSAADHWVLIGTLVVLIGLGALAHIEGRLEQTPGQTLILIVWGMVAAFVGKEALPAALRSYQQRDE